MAYKLLSGRLQLKFMTANPAINHRPVGWKYFWLVWVCVAILTARLEYLRLLPLLKLDGGFITWLSFWDMDTTMPLLVLLALPVLVRWGSSTLSSGRSVQAAGTSGGYARLSFAGLMIFLLSTFASFKIGAEPVSVQFAYSSATMPFAELPPAYHDEYSYLLQARTYRSLRLSYPPAVVRPDLFHQMHVLNEHRTVSRYFPTTGLWIAPFDAVGHPIYGHWLAGALAAVFFYLSLLQITRFEVAVLGGVLIAVSPGIAVFSNLLLAHHPTMLALSMFTCSYFRMVATGRMRFAFAAGTALTFAMLARPMTAAGYALPFGVWMALFLLRDRTTRKLAVGFAVPLLLGFSALAMLNHEATGRWSRSAYQEYTDRFTPRHRFGFNNGINAERPSGPPAVQKYDAWAENLTPEMAWGNVQNRLRSSFQWTLATMPLLYGIMMFLPAMLSPRYQREETESLECVGLSGFSDHQSIVMLRILASSVVTLHLVHIPYWYDGIMHWHYVFETAPLLLMLAAVGFVRAIEFLKMSMSGRLAAFWCMCLLMAGLLPGWVKLPMFDNVSKVSAAINEQAFSRVRFEQFRRAINAPVIQKPALVLVDETNTDPQLSYILNSPELNSDVIVCRRPGTDTEIEELRIAFGDRTIYLFKPSTFAFERWQETTSPID